MRLKPRTGSVDTWVKHFGSHSGAGADDGGTSGIRGGPSMNEVIGNGVSTTFLTTKPADQVSRAGSALKREKLKGKGRRKAGRRSGGSRRRRTTKTKGIKASSKKRLKKKKKQKKRKRNKRKKPVKKRKGSKRKRKITKRKRTVLRAGPPGQNALPLF